MGNWDEGENWKMDVKIEVTCEWNRWHAIPDIKKVLKCKVAPLYHLIIVIK